MTIRDLIYNTLTADSVLNGLGIDETNTFNSNDEDTPQLRPLMVLRWGASSVGLDVMNLRSLTVWIHDKPSDYAVIDQALERVRAVLTNMYGVNAGASDRWVAQIEWTGDSDDLTDDVQHTVCRNSQYNLVGSAS